VTSSYFSAGSGAFLVAGAGANMLAQLFLTPSGMMLEATCATTPVDVALVSQLLSAPAGVSVLVVVSHAVESVVAGTTFSLREPFVCATDAPRPRLPLLRSAPRPRPLPLSAPPRPPRETFPVLVASPNVLTVVSLALDFFTFETSPHCVMDPVEKKSQYWIFI